MRSKFTKFALAAILAVALTFTFSCYLDGINSNDTSYDYCITADNKCLTGPFTASTCSGQPSNNCPYALSSSGGKSSGNGVLASSSSSIILSSSSSGLSGVSSSSSSKQSSSSIPSSSSIITSSSSLVPSSSSSSVQSGVVYGTSVTYQGETYKTVVIGTQTWFQRNLNYAVAGSKCGYVYILTDENTANCKQYGRLYDWATAMALPANCNSNTCVSQISAKHKGICPSGWHIPSDAEWTLLTDFVGGSSTAGKYLKATSGWNEDGNGEDKYGFAALPGGVGMSDSYDFLNESYYGGWWSASELNGISDNFDDPQIDAINAYFRGMGYDSERIGEGAYYKSYFYSVRCIKD